MITTGDLRVTFLLISNSNTTKIYLYTKKNYITDNIDKYFGDVLPSLSIH